MFNFIGVRKDKNQIFVGNYDSRSSVNIKFIGNIRSFSDELELLKKNHSAINKIASIDYFMKQKRDGELIFYIFFKNYIVPRD